MFHQPAGELHVKVQSSQKCLSQTQRRLRWNRTTSSQCRRGMRIRNHLKTRRSHTRRWLKWNGWTRWCAGPGNFLLLKVRLGPVYETGLDSQEACSSTVGKLRKTSPSTCSRHSLGKLRLLLRDYKQI